MIAVTLPATTLRTQTIRVLPNRPHSHTQTHKNALLKRIVLMEVLSLASFVVAKEFGYFRGTVNIAFSERAFSERSHLVNGFKRDQSTPSKEKRAKEPSIERTRAFSERTSRLRSAFTQCDVDCIL